MEESGKGEGRKADAAAEKECVEELYKLAGGRDIRVLEEKGDDDFSFAVPGLSRFRVSAYKQEGGRSQPLSV